MVWYFKVHTNSILSKHVIHIVCVALSLFRHHRKAHYNSQLIIVHIFRTINSDTAQVNLLMSKSPETIADSGKFLRNKMIVLYNLFYYLAYSILLRFNSAMRILRSGYKIMPPLKMQRGKSIGYHSLQRSF